MARGRDQEPLGVHIRAVALGDGHVTIEALDVTESHRLTRVRRDFVANVSHELKTPLTSIQLAIYMLLEEATGPLTSKQTEMLLDARENCERLLAMVNNLLDLARLEEGWKQLDSKPESPESLLRTAADAIRLPSPQ